MDPRDPEVITFWRLERGDLPTVTRWLNTPHVYEWWGAARGDGNLGGAGTDAATLAAVDEEYGPEIDAGGPTEYFVIELDGAPSGLTQWYRLGDRDENAAYARAIGEPVDGTAGLDESQPSKLAMGVRFPSPASSVRRACAYTELQTLIIPAG